MDSVPLLGTIGWMSAGLGLGGLVVILFFARTRRVSSIALIAAFVAMTVGGGLLAGQHEASRSWGLALVLIGGAAGCIVAALTARRDLQLTQIADSADNAAAAMRRDLDALETTRSDLETQLTSARKRIQELLKKVEAEGPAESAHAERYRRRIERSKAREDKLRQVIDAARDGVIMLENETLRLAQFSPSVARMTGFAPDELVERTLLDLLVQGPSEPGRADLQRVAHERRPLAAKVVRADGTRLPVEITVQAVGRGDETQLMAILADASEGSRLSGELDALRAELAERDRHLDEIRSGRSLDAGRVRELEAELDALHASRERAIEAVAHDVRVPLTSVRSFSEILLRHEDTTADEQREFLEIIRKESERLTRLVDDLLDARRLIAGEQPMRAGDLDLRDVLRDALASVDGVARERGVTFEGLWDRESRTVHGERDRLQSMLVTLLANAVRASAKGGALELLLRDGQRPGATLFGIRDHGAGAGDEADGDIVFERFHAGSAGPEHAPGTGFGMSVCREIAAAHDAVIRPESREAGGRAMWVEFPPPAEMQSAVERARTHVGASARA